MTDPIADAIAALTRAEGLADSEGFEDSAAYFREVRSALLSAQGQAGKPVAWRHKPNVFPALWQVVWGPDSPGVGWQPLYVQPPVAAS